MVIQLENSYFLNVRVAPEFRSEMYGSMLK